MTDWLWATTYRNCPTPTKHGYTEIFNMYHYITIRYRCVTGAEMFPNQKTVLHTRGEVPFSRTCFVVFCVTEWECAHNPRYSHWLHRFTPTPCLLYNKFITTSQTVAQKCEQTTRTAKGFRRPPSRLVLVGNSVAKVLLCSVKMQYVYQKDRRDFGRQCLFTDKSDLLFSEPPNRLLFKDYILRNPVERWTQKTGQMSASEGKLCLFISLKLLAILFKKLSIATI